MDRIQRLIGERQEFSGLKTLLREDLGLVLTHTWNCLEVSSLNLPFCCSLSICLIRFMFCSFLSYFLLD